jgi:hypothetical protein
VIIHDLYASKLVMLFNVDFKSFLAISYIFDEINSIYIVFDVSCKYL